MPSPVKIQVGCDAAFYDLAHAYAAKTHTNVSALMRQALVEKIERERAEPRAHIERLARLHDKRSNNRDPQGWT